MKSHSTVVLMLVALAVAPGLSKPRHKKQEKNAKNDVGAPKYMAWSPSKKGDEPSKEQIDVLCENVDCPVAQYCKYGVCVCGGSDFCAKHYKPVCGSDGILYPSHCEMHRMACRHQKKIRIDRSGICEESREDDDDEDQENVKETKNAHKHARKSKKHGKDNQTHGKRHHRKNHQKKRMDDKPSIKKDLSFSQEEEPKQEKKQEKVELPPHVELKPKDVKVKDVEKVAEKKTAKEKTAKDEEQKTLIPVEPNQPVSDSLVAEKTESKPEKVKCTKETLKEFKEKLLNAHCDRLGEEACKKPEGLKKPFLANAMFDFFDKNYDELLDEWELDFVQHEQDKRDKLSDVCALPDLLKFDDTQKADDYLDRVEFHLALDIPDVFLEGPRVFHSTAVSDPKHSIELKCEINGATQIIWERNGIDLTTLPTHDIKVSQNGMLFIGPIALHHAGNYTCHDQIYPSVVQTHQLKVILPPKVEVYPHNLHYSTGLDVTIHCRADGIPAPKIRWEVNDFPIPDHDRRQHYHKSENKASLQIRNVKEKADTGVYKCKAINDAGEGQDLSTLFVTPELNKQAPVQYEMFMAFHADGYSVMKAEKCVESYLMKSSDHILDDSKVALHTLCQPDAPCEWGSAVNVRNRFIYVSQPSLNRVLMIDLLASGQWKPIEAIETDPFPVKLQYVEHMDQVWVLNWNSKEDTSSKSVQIIRSASIRMEHSTIHLRPMGNHFDAIKDLFLPPHSDIKHDLKYGYITHGEIEGLQKIDMHSMSYVSSVDLKKYNCIPKSVSFIYLRGQVIVDCTSIDKGEHKLILDYISDSVVKMLTTRGRTYVSPDARRIVNIEDDKHIIVHSIDDDGEITYAFESWPSLQVDDVTFVASRHHNGYDLYASAQGANQLWFMNLDSGKTTLLEGIGKKPVTGDRHLDQHLHALESSWRFGEHLIVPADQSVVIRNAHYDIQCERTGLNGVHALQWFMHGKE